MGSRPELTRSLDSRTFREYYYLKEELVTFCRNNFCPDPAKEAAVIPETLMLVYCSSSSYDRSQTS